MSLDPASIIEIIDPYTHLKAHLDQGVRADGRGFNEFRGLEIRCGADSSNKRTKMNNYGSAEVRLGDTLVFCNIALQIGVPSPTAPDDGDVDFDVSLNAICDPKYENIRTKHDDALDLETLLISVFSQGRIIDFKCLGIEKGERAFRLCVGVTVLSHSGNLQDAAILAVMAALSDVRLPDVVHPSDLAVAAAGAGNPDKSSNKASTTGAKPCITRTGNKNKKVTLLAAAVPSTVAVMLSPEKEWDVRSAVMFADPSKKEEAVLYSTVTTVVRVPHKSKQQGGEVELCGVFCSESEGVGQGDPTCRGGCPNDYVPSAEDAPADGQAAVVPAAVSLCVQLAKQLQPLLPYLK
jgi:exosome complex RNA-binding protein Rrp42 (RNase PH superfamily)